MNAFTLADVVASVGRALLGEVSPNLRAVRFRTAPDQIALCFYYARDPDDSERDSMGSVGAEVAADFSQATVTEEAITVSADSDIPSQDEWHTAYARKELSLAR
jgi:hypothetical protein